MTPQRKQFDELTAIVGSRPLHRQDDNGLEALAKLKELGHNVVFNPRTSEIKMTFIETSW